MNSTLKKLVLKELCPDGIWQLNDVAKSALRYEISRLPRRKVSEHETRYPQSPAGMRAFLVRFFARHYLQTQNSLVDYMTSQDFLEIVRSGRVKILDIGCGPAVTSLAITDMLVCALKHLKDEADWPRGKTVMLDYVLSDTSPICLGTGQRMLADYFRIGARHNSGITRGRTFSIQKAFPNNMNQLRRIKSNVGPYDITTSSYVVSPLNEVIGFRNLVDGFLNIESLCSREGRILILQDRFQEALMRRIARALGTSSEEEESTQVVYPERNTNETYTYSYYRCLYSPFQKAMVRKNFVA